MSLHATFLAQLTRSSSPATTKSTALSSLPLAVVVVGAGAAAACWSRARTMVGRRDLLGRRDRRERVPGDIREALIKDFSLGRYLVGVEEISVARTVDQLTSSPERSRRHFSVF